MYTIVVLIFRRMRPWAVLSYRYRVEVVWLVVCLLSIHSYIIWFIHTLSDCCLMLELLLELRQRKNFFSHKFSLITRQLGCFIRWKLFKNNKLTHFGNSAETSLVRSFTVEGWLMNYSLRLGMSYITTWFLNPANISNCFTHLSNNLQFAGLRREPNGVIITPGWIPPIGIVSERLADGTSQRPDNLHFYLPPSRSELNGPLRFCIHPQQLHLLSSKKALPPFGLFIRKKVRHIGWAFFDKLVILAWDYLLRPSINQWSNIRLLVSRKSWVRIPPDFPP